MLEEPVRFRDPREVRRLPGRSLRHEQLLKESAGYLERAHLAAVNGIPHEMLLLDLYGALRPIDAITGATTADATGLGHTATLVSSPAWVGSTAFLGDGTSVIHTIGRTLRRSFIRPHSRAFSRCTGSAAIAATCSARGRRTSRSWGNNWIRDEAGAGLAGVLGC